MNELKDHILGRLIEKGGLYGLAAKKYADHEIYGPKLILECFEQVLHRESIAFWGSELVRDIIKYRFLLLEEQQRELRKLLRVS